MPQAIQTGPDLPARPTLADEIFNFTTPLLAERTHSLTIPDTNVRATGRVVVVHGSNLAFCPACGSPLEERYVEVEERQRLVCVNCSRIHYVNPLIVAGAIPEIGDEIWLLRRAIEPRYGAWTFPAGYMEMWESLEEAAARETREELGIDIRIDSFVGVYSHQRAPSVLVVYRGPALTNPTGGAETLEFKRFRKDEIPWDELAFWNTRAALEDWVRNSS